MAKVDIGTVVRGIVSQNPALSQDSLQVLVRNNLQEMRNNGVKISPKQINQANAMVIQLTTEQSKAQFMPQVKPSVKKKVNVLNNSQAQVSYSASTSAVPTQISRKQAKLQSLLDGMTDLNHQEAGTFSQHLEMLEQKGDTLTKQKELAMMHEVDASAHVSSKQRKKQKKLAENLSQAEHKANRPILSKKQRNAIYCTENGIVVHENKKYLDYVQKQCNGKSSIIPIVDGGKSAQESFRVFEQNGLVRPAVSVEEVLNPRTKGAKLGIQEFIDVRQGLNTTPKSAKESMQVFLDALDTGKLPAEEGGKIASKFSKWGKIGLGIALVVGLGYTIKRLYNHYKEGKISE